MLVNEFKDLLKKALDGDQTALENWAAYLDSNLFTEEETTNALEIIDNALIFKTVPRSYALALRADMYREGQGLEVNYKEAIKLYKESYELGNSYSRTNRAHMHRLGQGGEPDYQAACWHYDLAIQQGNCQAMFYRAVMFERGMGSPPNYEKAFSLYQRLGSLGYTKALIGQATLLFSGKGCQADEKAAIALYEQASLHDKTGEVYNTLASFYHKKDPKKAIELCEQAVELGNANAMINLGALYTTLKNVNKADYATAIDLCFQSYLINQSINAIDAMLYLGTNPNIPDQLKKVIREKLALIYSIELGISKEWIDLKEVVKLVPLPKLILLINEEIVKRLNTIPSSSKIGATVTQALIDFTVTHHRDAVRECPKESYTEILLAPIYKGIENNLISSIEDHKNTQRLIELLHIHDPDYKFMISKQLRMKVWLHNNDLVDAFEFHIKELTDTSEFTIDELHLLAAGALAQLENWTIPERSRRIEMAGELYYRAFLRSKDESSYRFFTNLLHNKEFFLKGEKNKCSWTVFTPQDETEEFRRIKNTFLTELDQKTAINYFTKFIEELKREYKIPFFSNKKTLNRELAEAILVKLKLNIPLSEILENSDYSAQLSNDSDFSALISRIFTTQFNDSSMSVTVVKNKLPI